MRNLNVSKGKSLGQGKGWKRAHCFLFSLFFRQFKSPITLRTMQGHNTFNQKESNMNMLCLSLVLRLSKSWILDSVFLAIFLVRLEMTIGSFSLSRAYHENMVIPYLHPYQTILCLSPLGESLKFEVFSQLITELCQCWRQLTIGAQIVYLEFSESWRKCIYM